MKRTAVLAILAALAVTPMACGGGEDNKDSASAASADQLAQQEQAAPEEGQAPADTPAADPQNGDGGASAEDAKRAAGADKPASSGERAKSGGGTTKPKPAKPKTPQEHLAALSPGERRKLHRDLYKQGFDVCYAYGPKELAKNFNLPSSNPVRIAELYARAYEQATPSLILPYQQGCLAGFRKHERNPPKL